MPGTAVLSPHLDDAVLSLWHVLSVRRHDVRVVNVFAGVPDPERDLGGDCWWDRLTGAEDSARRMHERRSEDRVALTIAGATAVDLDLLEGQYHREPQPLEPVVSHLAEAVSEGTRLLAPAALDGHRSHRLVRAAALALREASGRPVTLYADVPHATRYGWPHWVTGAPAGPRLRPDAFWRRHMNGTGIDLTRLEPQVHRLDDADYGRKRAAVRAYPSQLAALEAEFAVLSRPDVLRYEVLWPLP